MKKAALIHLLMLLCCTAPLAVFGQDNAPFNKIEVRSIQPLIFSYGTATALLSTQTITNALEVSVKVKQEDVMVMAQVQFTSGVRDAFKRLLGLQLINRSSSNAQVPDDVVLLSNTPALLFIQPRSTSGVKHHSFNYNVFLKPSETILPPGSHGFSVLFTLTPQ